jgi:hypothetical protein
MQTVVGDIQYNALSHPFDYLFHQFLQALDFVARDPGSQAGDQPDLS